MVGPQHEARSCLGAVAMTRDYRAAPVLRELHLCWLIETNLPMMVPSQDGAKVCKTLEILLYLRDKISGYLLTAGDISQISAQLKPQ